MDTAMSRNGMLGKILSKSPGIYIHLSFKALGWIIFILILITVLCIDRVHINFNPGPVEYPMFIDGKKIVFLGREPQSITEARSILSRYDHKFQDGDRVANSE